MASVTSAIGGRTHVVMNGAALNDLLRGTNGPVVRRLMVDGQRVKAEARRLVGVKSGNLRDHIVTRVTTIGGEPAVVVGVFDTKSAAYALWHHEGAKPHPIVARRTPKLVFFWPKLGRVVGFPRVSHPGNKPNRFLTKALRILR